MSSSASDILTSESDLSSSILPDLEHNDVSIHTAAQDDKSSTVSGLEPDPTASSESEQNEDAAAFETNLPELLREEGMLGQQDQNVPLGK
jgi:hypothetical protein